jgi:hypothetical protein
MSTLSSNPLPICPKCNKPMPFLSESAGMPKVERFNCKACKVLCRIEMEFDYYGESTTVEPETECGACDKPGEHCARPYGICVRHCKPKARDEQEDAYNAAARVMADKASTVSPPSADIEALLESFVWAVRRDNDARDKYTQQEVKDLRAELLAAIRPVQPPSDDVKHYERRLKDLLPFAGHRISCNYVETGGDCTCGFTALALIIRAEIYESESTTVTKSAESP